MLTIGSLFAGIGGLELGLERAGLGRVVWQCEIDPFCRAVLARHWPDATRYEDVRSIDETVERVDVVCGGFPCQDISVAGNGAGLDGERSGLWAEFARVVRVLLPRVVVVENVAALLSRGVDRVLGDLSACGYDAEWSTLRASDVGAPHLRDRLFVVAVLADAVGDGRAARHDLGTRRQAGRYASACGSDVADTDGGRREEQRIAKPGGIEGARGDLVDGSRAAWRLDDGARACAVSDAERDAVRLLAERDQREGRSARTAERGNAESRHDREDGRGRAESGVGRVLDGLSVGLDGARWPAGPDEEPYAWEPPRALPKGRIAGRRERLKALGNAVVPQCAEIVGRVALRALEKST